MTLYTISDITKPFAEPIKIEANSPKEAVEKAFGVKVNRNDKGNIVVYGNYESGRYGYTVKSFVYEVEK